MEALVAEGPEAGVAARLLSALAGGHDLQGAGQDLGQVLPNAQHVAGTTRDSIEERQRRRPVFGAEGDEVVLWGRFDQDKGAPAIDVMELAARAGTIGYELLTRVGGRVMRVSEQRSAHAGGGQP